MPSIEGVVSMPGRVREVQAHRTLAAEGVEQPAEPTRDHFHTSAQISIASSICSGAVSARKLARMFEMPASIG